MHKTISIFEHFVAVKREDREWPVMAFCTSRPTDEARKKIEAHLMRPNFPIQPGAVIQVFDLNSRTGALRANGALFVSA